MASPGPPIPHRVAQAHERPTGKPGPAHTWVLSLHFQNRPWVAARLQESVAPAEGLADLGVLAGMSSVLTLARVLCGAGKLPQIGDSNFPGTEVYQALGLGRSWGEGSPCGGGDPLFQAAILLGALTPVGGSSPLGFLLGGTWPTGA